MRINVYILKVKIYSGINYASLINILKLKMMKKFIPILYRKKIWNYCIMANNLKIYY